VSLSEYFSGTSLPRSSWIKGHYCPSVLWHGLVGRQEGHPACKKWGDSGGGHWVRMEWCPAGRCLPLLVFPCTIKSRSSLLAPAHPGGPGKRAVKWLWWCLPMFCCSLAFVLMTSVTWFYRCLSEVIVLCEYFLSTCSACVYSVCSTEWDVFYVKTALLILGSNVSFMNEWICT